MAFLKNVPVSSVFNSKDTFQMWFNRHGLSNGSGLALCYAQEREGNWMKMQASHGFKQALSAQTQRQKGTHFL